MYHHLLNRGVSADPITSEYCELNVDYCFDFLNWKFENKFKKDIIIIIIIIKFINLIH